jgi:hypothetical protein
MSIPLREFGKTGVTAIEIVHRALDGSITFYTKTPMRSPEWLSHANFSEFRLLNSAPKDFGIRPMRASRPWSHNSELHTDPS